MSGYIVSRFHVFFAEIFCTDEIVWLNCINQDIRLFLLMSFVIDSSLLVNKLSKFIKGGLALSVQCDKTKLLNSIFAMISIHTDERLVFSHYPRLEIIPDLTVCLHHVASVN